MGSGFRIAEIILPGVCAVTLSACSHTQKQEEIQMESTKKQEIQTNTHGTGTTETFTENTTVMQVIEDEAFGNCKLHEGKSDGRRADFLRHLQSG